jgi:tryptophan synthase beta chain
LKKGEGFFFCPKLPVGSKSKHNQEGGTIVEHTKYLLTEKEMPTSWYNIQADLPKPLAPAIHPGTMQPLGPADLAPLFPMELIMQEVSQERYIDIPGEVIDIYKAWRPTTLYRARALEKALDTPAKIFYKYEGSSPAGSHKPNTAVPQAFYNKKEGIKRLTTETGAGQWGSSMAFACCQFDIELKVYMVKVSYQQKPYRRMMMETWGAQCVPSPSPDTNSGRAALAEDPNSPGSLGLAISEAVEDAAPRADSHYSLGSVLNHVLMHQTGIAETDGNGRRISRRCHRLRRRRFQLRRYGPAFCSSESDRRQKHPHHRRGTIKLPHPDQG